MTNVFIKMEMEIEQRALKIDSEEGIVETAKNFLQSGFSVDIVTESTKLSVMTVEQLQANV